MIALFAAVECGDAKKVEELLTQIPKMEIKSWKSPDWKDYRDRTPLHLAIERGHLDVVDVLLGFEDNLAAAKDGVGFTALHLAAELGYDKLVTRLLETSPKSMVCEMTSTGLTCLHLAVIKGHATIVRQLLTTNPELLVKVRPRRKSALCFAIEYGHQEIVDMLVESANKNVDDAKMMLYHAIKFGYVAIASQLLTRNPELMDVRIDSQGDDDYEAGILRDKSVWHLAVEHGRDIIVSQLLAAKPDLINQRFVATTRASGVLHLAAKNGHDKVVSQLLAAKPDLGSQIDSDRRTVLHIAALHSNDKVVALLLAQNPKLVDVSDRCGETPLHLAVGRASLYPVVGRMNDHTALGKTVACLLAHKPARVDEKLLWSCLRNSNSSSHDEAVKLLVQHKPELVREKDGSDTVLHRVFGYSLPSKTHFSEDMMLLMWQMNPEALHQTNNRDETPFHVAIRGDNQFAIELVQDKLSLDEIMEAYATCKKESPLSIMDKLHECLSASLNKDLSGIVSSYFVPPPPPKEIARSFHIISPPQELHRFHQEMFSDSEQEIEEYDGLYYDSDGHVRGGEYGW